MQVDDRDRSILNRHKRWADGLTAIWMFIAIALFVAVHFLLVQTGAAEGERTQAFILLATLILVGCVWQAAGLAIARIEIGRGPQ